MKITPFAIGTRRLSDPQNVKGNWAAARDLKLKTKAGRRLQLTDLLASLCGWFW